MGVVMLPIVSSTTTVDVALKLLRERKRGGVVVAHRDGTYRLLYASDLFRAKAQKVDTVAGVRKRRPVLLLDNSKARKYRVDLVRPLDTWQQYERMLTKLETDFALALDFQGSAVVITRHELQEDALSTSGGYRCNGQPRHYFPDPYVSARVPCPRYPECSLPGGAVPKIVPNS